MRTRVPKTLMVVLLVAFALSGGCTGGDPENKASRTGTAANLPTVEVSASGDKFDPPIQVVQLPPGVWYCDMGTTHYARGEEDDGVCPVCGMTLVRKPGAGLEESDDEDFEVE